jgi:hypothetical protein
MYFNPASPRRSSCSELRRQPAVSLQCHTQPKVPMTRAFRSTASNFRPDTASGRWSACPPEAGNFNELRGILGNAIAMRAHGDGTLLFLDGTILAKLAWKHIPSAEFDGAFVPRPTTKAGVQIMVKDSKRDAATGGKGVWPVHRRQTGRRSAAQNMLPLPQCPREKARMGLHAMHALKATPVFAPLCPLRSASKSPVVQ